MRWLLELRFVGLGHGGLLLARNKDVHVVVLGGVVQDAVGAGDKLRHEGLSLRQCAATGQQSLEPAFEVGLLTGLHKQTFDHLVPSSLLLHYLPARLFKFITSLGEAHEAGSV